MARHPVAVLVAALAVAAAVAVAGVRAQVPATVKPKRLVSGVSAVRLISPASPYSQEVSYPASEYVGFITANLTALYNVTVTYGAHMSDVWGYLAGYDADRAHDVTAAFADPTADAVWANRGGFGCTRIVDAVDFDAVAANPKVFMGYSDLTTFLLAVHFRTGLVTFHGPMGIDAWSGADGQATMNGEYVQRVLFNGEAVLMRNPPANATTTLVSGKARGKLVGGNLSLLYALLGTPWLPVASIPWEQYVLFVEDVGEQPYTIDRMLTSLHLAGVLPRVAGVVWGTCTRCAAQVPSQSFTVEQVLQQKLGGLSAPVFTGLLFGHNGEQFTIPIGVMAEIDADAGTIQLLESAVI